MTIKSILVSLDGTDSGLATLETGLMVAAKFKAHADALHVRPDSLTAVPAIGDAMNGEMAENFSQGHQSEHDERSKAARAMFEAACLRRNIRVVEGGPTPDGLSASFLDRVGQPHAVMCRLGRVHDLVVVGQPSHPKDMLRSLTIDALFQTGRPVLVVPKAVPKSLGKVIAIGWNGSAECARAIGGATNFFSQAEKVVVLTAESEHTPKTVIPELVSYLQCHGVKVETRIIGQMGKAHLGGHQLLAAAEVEQADLLVMGAKLEKNKVKRMFLGCATSDVLNSARIPLLMGH
jgi:nucleotide-binding universal stress UspA family protein